MVQKSKAAPFRSCSACMRQWAGLSDFLADPAVILGGYQVNFDRLEAGFFLFHHITPDCGTTMTIPVGKFRGLYDGPVYKKRLQVTAECPGYCQKRSVFKLCPARCECAYVRQILDIVHQWPKKKAG
ncbi:MAG: hypothetical protein HYV36_07705 [Lentisphaerae bacterium]|nr:hypothetical protein [Lentisphaerota bacterium]